MGLKAMSLITKAIQVAGWAVLGPQFVVVLEGLPAWVVAQFTIPAAATATAVSISAPTTVPLVDQGSPADGFAARL